MLKLKIKYHDNGMPKLERMKEGDWIDLRVVNITNLPSIRWTERGQGWYIYSGDEVRVSLGISIELPKGYEALIAPRSSLFKKHGLILTNSIGVIDNTYCGDGDVWGGILYCIKGSTFLKKYERILQFRIIENMPELYFEEVDCLGNKDRGGFGKTGRL